MIKPILVILLLFAGSTAFGQSRTAVSNLESTNLSLLNYLQSEKHISPLAPEDTVYILNNDSFFMFERSWISEEGSTYDTMLEQLHAVLSNGNWELLESEIINLSKYRGGNPVFKYKPYFKLFDPSNAFYAKVSNGQKWGFINDHGHVIVPILYDEVKLHLFGVLAIDSVGMRIINIDNGNTSDVYELLTTQSPKIRSYKTRLSIVIHQGKQGMLNSDLELIIPFYDEIKLYRFNVIFGKRNEGFYVLNPLTGKEISRKYDSFEPGPTDELVKFYYIENGITKSELVNAYGEVVEL